MRHPARVARIEFDSANGVCGITIERAGYMSTPTPSPDDLPNDIRSALHDWITGAAQTMEATE